MPRIKNPLYDRPFFAGPTVVELSIPSGKVIISDDLRKPKHFDIESPLDLYSDGLDEWARMFAGQVNVGYAFVGNTCPTVTRLSDGGICVVSGEYDEDTDVVALEDGETEIFTICTDHWAAMITDYQNWIDNGGPTIERANEGYGLQKFEILDVTPGRYRWTAFSHSDSFDTHAVERNVYAQLELIEAY